jgi:hypothetical protein
VRSQSRAELCENNWKRWQLQQRIRIERVSGVGSWQNNLRSNGKKGIRLCKEDFTVCCNDSETVINPFPGYD